MDVNDSSKLPDASFPHLLGEGRDRGSAAPALPVSDSYPLKSILHGPQRPYPLRLAPHWLRFVKLGSARTKAVISIAVGRICPSLVKAFCFVKCHGIKL